MVTTNFLESIYHTIEEIDIVQRKFNLTPFGCYLVKPIEERKLLQQRYGRNFANYEEITEKV